MLQHVSDFPSFLRPNNILYILYNILILYIWYNIYNIIYIIYMCHIWFIHSSISRHLSCFYPMSTGSNAMNTGILLSTFMDLFFLCPGTGERVHVPYLLRGTPPSLISVYLLILWVQFLMGLRQVKILYIIQLFLIVMVGVISWGSLHLKWKPNFWTLFHFKK